MLTIRPRPSRAKLGGAGDDARVEFRAGGAPIEIQAKHGLKPQKCIEAFEAIRDGSTPADATEVMLVVDSTSSPAIRNDLWRDLDRLRSGRGDALKDLTRNIVSILGSRADDVTRRTHILTLDLGRHSDPGATRALEILTDTAPLSGSDHNAATPSMTTDAVRVSATVGLQAIT